MESLSNDQLDDFILYGPAFARRVLEKPIVIITGQESKPANVLFFFTHEKEKKIAARKAHARNSNKALLFTNSLHAKVNGKPTIIAFKTFAHETNTNKYQLGYANNGDCYIKSQDSDEYSKISRIVGYDYDEDATEEDGAESDESENHSEQEEDFGE